MLLCIVWTVSPASWSVALPLGMYRTMGALVSVHTAQYKTQGQQFNHSSGEMSRPMLAGFTKLQVCSILQCNIFVMGFQPTLIQTSASKKAAVTGQTITKYERFCRCFLTAKLTYFLTLSAVSIF
jgi:hypothetical protein